MIRLVLLLLFCGVHAAGQASSGSLHLWVSDSAGRGIRTTVHLTSEANQYRSVLDTDNQGHLEVRQLPYGIYTLQIQQDGFSPVSESVAIRSSIPTRYPVQLKLPTTITRSHTAQHLD